MDAEIDLRTIFSFIRRQARLILAVFLAVIGLASIYIFTLTPIYTATTLVMFDPQDGDLLHDRTQNGFGSLADPRVEGEVLLARSDNVLLSVIERENLLDDPELHPQLGFSARVLSLLGLQKPALPSAEQALQQALSVLGHMVKVQRQRSTYLINISASSVSPDNAERISNALARAYIDTQLSAKVQSISDARDVLVEQLGAARQSVIASEGSFDRYIEANLGSIIEQTSSPELSTLQVQMRQLGTLRQAHAAEVATLQSLLAGQDYSALASRLADQDLAELEEERQGLLARLQDEAAIASDIDLRQELAGVEARLVERANLGISSIQAELQQTQVAENSLRQNLRTAIVSSGLPPKTLTELYDLQQQTELSRQQYDQLLLRSQQLQAQATLQLPDSRVVSPALRPSEPSAPNSRLMLMTAALAGIALGVALAFLYEFFIGGVTSDEQLAALARARSAVVVPRAKVQPNQLSVADLVVDAPLSAFSEAVRRIRTDIDRGLRLQKERPTDLAPVIMVASTVPGEGKTTLSLSIARSYALAGQSTLLIDCDLRRPSLHRELGAQPSDNLVSLLQSRGPNEVLDDAILKDDLSDLYTLVGSTGSRSATDQLITSPNFGRLLSASRRTFDVIILDTPPLSPVVDGIYLAKLADAVVMVVQWASTAQQEVRKSLLSIEGENEREQVIVPVLNQQEVTSSPYHRRYASYYQEKTV